MQLHNNYVLVRLTKKTDELQLPGIGTLAVETVFDEERHQRLVGEVIQNPPELAFRNMDHSTMPWETTIETQVGDEVIMRRTDVSVARNEGRSFERDGHLFIYIEYHALILVKRKFTVEDYAREFCFHQENTVKVNDEYFNVIMLNGFILVEQEEEDLGTTLTLPDEFKGKRAERGRIAFIGSCNTAYHDNYTSAGHKIASNLPDNRFDLKVGDRIGFLPHSGIDLEFEIHQSFNGSGKPYIRMQRNKILCKLD